MRVTEPILRALGHGSTARLLLVQADDLGMCHSVNSAIFEAFEQGTITSASVMVPCPGFEEVADYARSHPDVDLGIHLTVTSEWEQFKWGPISSPQHGSGLTTPLGHFWATPDDLIQHQRGSVAEELEAQMNRAISAGITPTHVDTHMFALFRKRHLFQAYLSIAQQFAIPCLLPPSIATSIPEDAWSSSRFALIPDCVIQVTRDVHELNWKQYYINALRSLPIGLTVLLVHPGYDNSEFRAITRSNHGWDSQWRQRDSTVLGSADFKSALEASRVSLVTWKDLRLAWKEIAT